MQTTTSLAFRAIVTVFGAATVFSVVVVPLTLHVTLSKANPFGFDPSVTVYVPGWRLVSSTEFAVLVPVPLLSDAPNAGGAALPELSLSFRQNLPVASTPAVGVWPGVLQSGWATPPAFAFCDSLSVPATVPEEKLNF